MENSNNAYSVGKAVDLLVRLGLLFLLLGWCMTILSPFILILVWGTVISIALFPMHNMLTKKLRFNRILSATLITLVMLSIIILPALLLVRSVGGELGGLKELYQSGKPIIPMPPPSTDTWPAIARPIVDLWRLASENLQQAAMQYSDQLKMAGGWVLKAIAAFGKGVVQFIASILIAGVLLAFAGTSHTGMTKLSTRLAGSNGPHFINIITSTIRNVVKGILGVAVIQAAMAALGFFMAGVPFAGLWSVLVLILAVIQVGAGPVAIPVAIYMFSVADTTTAVILALWLGLTLIADNFLKPILLGRGASVPMLVVFLGAIGGFITSGFLGLFLGAVVLTIGYKLYIDWLNADPAVKAL